MIQPRFNRPSFLSSINDHPPVPIPFSLSLSSFLFSLPSTCHKIDLGAAKCINFLMDCTQDCALPLELINLIIDDAWMSYLVENQSNKWILHEMASMVMVCKDFLPKFPTIYARWIIENPASYVGPNTLPVIRSRQSTLTTWRSCIDLCDGGIRIRGSQYLCDDGTEGYDLICDFTRFIYGSRFILAGDLVMPFWHNLTPKGDMEWFLVSDENDVRPDGVRGLHAFLALFINVLFPSGPK